MKSKCIIGLVLLLSGCSQYSQKWECETIKGLKCASIEKAEEIARDRILLNTASKEISTEGKIEIKEHYEGFKKVPKKIIGGIR